MSLVFFWTSLALVASIVSASKLVRKERDSVLDPNSQVRALAETEEQLEQLKWTRVCTTSTTTRGANFHPLTSDIFTAGHPPLPDKIDQRLHYVENAVINDCGRVWQNGLFLDADYHGCCYSHLAACGKHSADDSPTHHFETVVVLTQVFPTGYYHFVVEALTRIIHIHKENATLLKTAYFHLGLRAAAWAELVGINPGRMVNGTISASNVVMPQSNGCGQIIKEYAIEARRVLHHSMWNELPVASPRNAVLVRRTVHRRLLNHAKLLELLNGFGYSVTELIQGQEPDIRLQCKSFADASVIIGPHGAAFSNLLCTGAGSHVVEIQQSPHNPCYENLCGKLELDYIGIASSITHFGAGEVSIEAVRKALIKLG